MAAIVLLPPPLAKPGTACCPDGMGAASVRDEWGGMAVLTPDVEAIELLPAGAVDASAPPAGTPGKLPS